MTEEQCNNITLSPECELLRLLYKLQVISESIRVHVYGQIAIKKLKMAMEKRILGDTYSNARFKGLKETLKDET